MKNQRNNKSIKANGVPHRIKFGVSFSSDLLESVKDAASKDRRSVSNWLEIAALDYFRGCATPQEPNPQS